eukprot:scaffold9156_cov92-Skeletonema_dohrnii-CCMP3373.AAC.2
MGVKHFNTAIEDWTKTLRISIRRWKVLSRIRIAKEEVYRWKWLQLAVILACIFTARAIAGARASQILTMSPCKRRSRIKGDESG